MCVLSSSVDHECVIGDGVHIAPGAHLAAGVTVERGSWVGIGSVVKGGVHIGSDVMIGAGSVVLHDISDGALAYGVPARVVRQQVSADAYATYQLGSKSAAASKA